MTGCTYFMRKTCQKVVASFATSLKLQETRRTSFKHMIQTKNYIEIYKYKNPKLVATR